jgi:hypothetical protein
MSACGTKQTNDRGADAVCLGAHSGRNSIQCLLLGGERKTRSGSHMVWS